MNEKPEYRETVIPNHDPGVYAIVAWSDGDVSEQPIVAWVVTESLDAEGLTTGTAGVHPITSDGVESAVYARVGIVFRGTVTDCDGYYKSIEKFVEAAKKDFAEREQLVAEEAS